MYKLSFRPLAQNDIQQIIDYYDEISPKLSMYFLNDLEIIISHIQNAPEANLKKLNNIRVAFLKRFRYGVYFKIYKNEIVIIAILHTSRNPKIWKKRK